MLSLKIWGSTLISLKEITSERAQAVFLDVRTGEEFSEGSIPGAININYRAYHLLKMAGFTDVKKMTAGLNKW